MMRSKRDKLIEYMRDKSNYLYLVTGISLYDEPDYMWARTLSTEIVFKIYNRLFYVFEIDDPSICPQCIEMEIAQCFCKYCDYAKHHEVCGDGIGTYNRIVNKMFRNASLSIFIGHSTLLHYFKWNR